MFTLVPLLRHQQDNAGTTAATAVFGQSPLATGEWRPIRPAARSHRRKKAHLVAEVGW
jgi:hypothetical protein